MTETEAPRPSRKLAAAKASIAASAFLAVAKLAAGLWSGSLALLSEAGHACVDAGATVLTYLAVREAEKPADADHHYGHGKFEALAALAETGLLFGLALVVVGEAFRRLSGPHVEIEAGWHVYAVLCVSIAVDFARSRKLSAIAASEHSDALAADALHFASDLVSSILVLIGLAATQFGFLHGDTLAAFGVAAFIAVAGFRLGRRTISTLLDAAPPELAARLEQAIVSAPGVISLESLRLRSVGPEVIGEATIGVARTLRVEQAGRIKEGVVASIAATAPQARVTVAAEPRALDDETVVERVTLVAARRHLTLHHVIAQQVVGKLSIGLAIALDGAKPFGAAYAIAKDFERAIRDEFGVDVEIETQIEPLAPHLIEARDVDPDLAARVSAFLRRHGAKTRVIYDIGEIRVREAGKGLIVTYRCRAPRSISVESTHAAVARVERCLRDEFPAILRVVCHAEPGDG